MITFTDIGIIWLSFVYAVLARANIWNSLK
jgi:hypothetical protein